MSRAYAQDLRERVLAAVDAGVGVYQAAPLFRVSVSYIYKALSRRRSTGETTARAARGRPGLKLAPCREALLAKLRQQPDTTLLEWQAWLAREHDLRVSIGCLWNTLERWDLRLKKSRSGPPSRIGRMSPRPAVHGASARAS